MSISTERMNSWATLNRLKLHVSKTKTIVIGSPYFINALRTVANSFMYVRGVSVDYESPVRGPGVALENCCFRSFRASSQKL